MGGGGTTREGAGHSGLMHTESRQVVDGLRTEVCGQQKQSNDPRNNQHNLNTPTNWKCAHRVRCSPKAQTKVVDNSF